MPLLFTFSEYLQADKSLCDLPGFKPGQFSIVRDDNQELRVPIQRRVTGNHCFIIGSVTPPKCQMVSFLLLAHTLKKEGATQVTGHPPVSCLLGYLDVPNSSLSSHSCSNGSSTGNWHDCAHPLPECRAKTG